MTMLREKHLKRIIAKEEKVVDAAYALDVRPETVSRWLAKYKFEGLDGIFPKKPGPKGGMAHNRTSKELEDQVITLANKNLYEGPIWIADKIGNQIDQSTVYRILKRRGVRYGPHYSHKKRKKKRYCLDRPGRELQLDVCFPFGYARKIFVYDAIDDCTRIVFAKVMTGHNTETTIKFLEELIEKTPFKIEAIRTDQGREFSKAVTEWLNARGIEHKKNPPYTPQHNGKIERYHRTFKENEAYFWDFNASVDELNFGLFMWLKEYNFNRKHGGLGMNRMTPVQKFFTLLLTNISISKNMTGSLQHYKT